MRSSCLPWAITQRYWCHHHGSKLATPPRSASLSCYICSWFPFLFLSHLVLPTPGSIRDLSSLTGIKLVPPTLEAQCLNHWITREVPDVRFLIQIPDHFSYWKVPLFSSIVLPLAILYWMWGKGGKWCEFSLCKFMIFRKPSLLPYLFIYLCLFLTPQFPEWLW